MTKRDFQLIADVVREHREITGDDESADRLAAAFADRLAKTNERFARPIFLAACDFAGPEKGGYR